ncbi:molybdopterin-guanine dinucleotide biosynthesis protein MobA [Bacteroidia bacterium]|nr:molybdopterin-guanine dinucleotide biosynthesis protein MobA [Bacteroidia bacterium]
MIFMEKQLIWVTDAKYVDGYRISVTFNDDLKKIIDLKAHLCGKIFEPLKDIENFKKFSVSGWSVAWKNGADMAPEFLYRL